MSKSKPKPKPRPPKTSAVESAFQKAIDAAGLPHTPLTEEN